MSGLDTNLPLRESIFQDLSVCARENGYEDVFTMDSYDVACELISMTSTYQHLQPQDLVAAVREWQLLNERFDRYKP